MLFSAYYVGEEKGGVSTSLLHNNPATERVISIENGMFPPASELGTSKAVRVGRMDEALRTIHASPMSLSCNVRKKIPTHIFTPRTDQN